ncbi:hypothetical protein EV363DRAFT_1178691 [Boletus edulis]|nr:hypothetical protein EV363DRAFT_1185128 [Boletus edulis]KAF8124086.1 hypothetical protein EV363DRAFT_1178691 [Boletus edulis]
MVMPNDSVRDVLRKALAFGKWQWQLGTHVAHVVVSNGPEKFGPVLEESERWTRPKHRSSHCSYLMMG